MQRISRRIVSVLPLCFALSAVPSLLAQEPPTGTVAGVAVLEDGSAVPGAQVTIRNKKTNEEHLKVTDENGRFVAGGLPAGDYTVTSHLEGFADFTDDFVFVLAGHVTNTKFLMRIGAESDEAIILRNITNSATNRPPYLMESDLPAGGLAVGFGESLGPDIIVSAQRLPLDANLEGFEAWVQQNQDRFPCLPVYVVESQFACVVSSDARTGPGEFFVSYQGMFSNPFRVQITDVQPGIYTYDSNGQDQGVFTDDNFSVFTLGRSARPGQQITAWGTGWGRALADDRPLVHDKRFNYDSIELTVGGYPIPEENIAYLGAAGGFAGGDQIIVTLPQSINIFGCAVPVAGGVVFRGRFFPVNPVTIPISADGGPCGDPHDLPAFAVDTMARDGNLTIGLGFVAESTVLLNGAHIGSMRANFRVNSITERTYNPLPALNTMTYTWRPENRGDPFLPEPVQMTGDLDVILPFTQFTMFERPFPVPYFNFFSPPETFTFGAYQWDFSDDFTVADAPFTEDLTGDYNRIAGAVMDQIRGSDPSTIRDLETLLEAVRQLGPGSPDVIIDYEAHYVDGPLGTHITRTAFRSNISSEAAENLLAQENTILESLAPDEPIDRFANLRIAPVTPFTEPQENTIDFIRVVFDAEDNFTITVHEDSPQ